MATIELPDELKRLETLAWREIQAGQLTVDTANAVQDAVTRYATEAEVGRYEVEMALKKAVRHVEE